jgi:hypothetical protein
VTTPAFFRPDIVTWIYDSQVQPDTYPESIVAKGRAGLLLRTFRTANCVASRLAQAHRQLIIVTMTFMDYLAGMMFYQGRIALLLVCQIFCEKWQRELASRSLSSSGRRTSRQSIVSYVEGMR